MSLFISLFNGSKRLVYFRDKFFKFTVGVYGAYKKKKNHFIKKSFNFTSCEY